MILDLISENYPEESFIYPSGHENAVIGYDYCSMRLIIDLDIVIQNLMEEGMSEIDAIEYCSYNITGSYIGEKTPIYLQRQ
jgi:hypothetical protein